MQASSFYQLPVLDEKFMSSLLDFFIFLYKRVPFNHFNPIQDAGRGGGGGGSNPFKIELVITSLTEMVQLPHFGHVNTSAI